MSYSWKTDINPATYCPTKTDMTSQATFQKASLTPKRDTRERALPLPKKPSGDGETSLPLMADRASGIHRLLSYYSLPPTKERMASVPTIVPPAIGNVTLTPGMP